MDFATRWLKAAFQAAEDDGLAPALVETDHPRTLDGGAAERNDHDMTEASCGQVWESPAGPGMRLHRGPVEPIGGDMVRVYHALERNGAWEDQFTVLMPMAVIPTLTSFVTVSAREISAEVAAAAEHVTHWTWSKRYAAGLRRRVFLLVFLLDFQRNNLALNESSSQVGVLSRS
jgi:hypothetical protein